MRSLASIVLAFESVVLALVTPVMISVADVRPAVAVPVCVGLFALALVATGLLRFRARPRRPGPARAQEQLGSAGQTTSKES